MSDLCELSGYSRDQMRALLAELPRFANRHSEARIARVFSNHDVMLVVLLCRLEAVYALKRSAVATLCEPIATALTAPREVSKRACLVLRVQDATCEYLDPAPAIDDGLVVALEPVFLTIDSYMLPMPLVQREVGLSATGTLRKPASATLDSGRQTRRAQRNMRQGQQRGRSNHG